MKQAGNWILILLVVIVAFFAYRKFSEKKALIKAAESQSDVESPGENPNENRGAPGGRGGVGPKPAYSGSADGKSRGRAGAHPPSNNEKIDLEKKRKLLQGQPVFNQK